MTSNWPPKKNVAFTWYFFVYKNDGSLIVNPTLASSAVHVDGNTTEVTNSTLAVVDSTTGLCSIAIAQAAMNGDQIDGKVVASDAGAVVYTFKLLTTANTQDEVGTDVAAVHTHVNTIDGHITADYAAAEKTAVDKITATPPTASDNATAVWAAGTKALTDKAGFSLATAPPTAAEVWAAGTRALTDKSGYSGIATNMVAAAPDAAAVNAACDAAIADAALATVAALTTVDGNVDSILADTDELQTNQGSWATATGFSTFDPATDDVAVVNLVDTTTDLTNAGAGGLDEAGVRTAIGMASADLDTQLGGLDTKIGTPAQTDLSTELHYVHAHVSADDLAGDVTALVTAAIVSGAISSVTVTSPVAASGTITIEQGDSYSASRGRPIDVNVDDVAHTRQIDADNVTVYLLATQFTWEAISVTETTPGYRVRFEPTIAETAAVTMLMQSYKLKACIDNQAPTDDDAETIVRGTVVLKRDIAPVD